MKKALAYINLLCSLGSVLALIYPFIRVFITNLSRHPRVLSGQDRAISMYLAVKVPPLAIMLLSALIILFLLNFYYLKKPSSSQNEREQSPMSTVT